MRKGVKTIIVGARGMKTSTYGARFGDSKPRPRPRWLLLVGLLATALGGCEKYELDRRMEELCKQDGGVHVYETVTLPPEMFDPEGYPFPGWRQRTEENRLDPEYRFVRQTTYLKKGEPLKGEGQLIRNSWKVIRRSDGKLLGESVLYGRSGGDFISFDHFTSKSCPSQVGNATVIQAVFIKRGT